VLVALLESAGREAFGPSDGKAAITYAREHPVALLITDLIMPGQEGMETIRQFVKEFPDIPIIAISGNPDYFTLRGGSRRSRSSNETNRSCQSSANGTRPNRLTRLGPKTMRTRFLSTPIRKYDDEFSA
jgi:CheY-like chemotaxis protein